MITTGAAIAYSSGLLHHGRGFRGSSNSAGSVPLVQQQKNPLYGQPGTSLGDYGCEDGALAHERA